MKAMKKLAALLFFLIFALTAPNWPVSAQTETPPPEVAPQDIINAINSAREAHGYKPLKVNAILMSTAQQTAEIMAANQMSGHIGDVRGRVWQAGYGAGDTPWATENFLIGPLPLETILMAWSDDVHMIPIANPNYCHIGVGIAESGDNVYYVLHAAYTSNHACNNGAAAKTPGKETPNPATATMDPNPMSQWIFPVRTVTPQNNGWAIHTVQQGQTLWSIAMAYGAKEIAIINANALSPDNPMIYTGQKLFIPVTITPTSPTPNRTQTAPATSASAPTPTLNLVAVVNMPLPTSQPASTAQPPANNPTQAPRDRAITIALVAAFGLGCALVMLGIVLKK